MQLSCKRPSTFEKYSVEYSTIEGQLTRDFFAANVAKNEAPQLCVGGRWGDRDQPSRMSSDLDSKSTQTRGSPTCQTERVTRAH